MTRQPRRNVRKTLANVAARLRSNHAGERQAARRMLLLMCYKYDIDPREYGVEPPSREEFEEQLYAGHFMWERARLLDRHAAEMEAYAPRAPRPESVLAWGRLMRFEAERERIGCRDPYSTAPNGNRAGCAPMVPGYEDIPHKDYCRSPVCPQQPEGKWDLRR